jgi:hypothetical protein
VVTAAPAKSHCSRLILFRSTAVGQSQKS